MTQPRSKSRQKSSAPNDVEQLRARLQEAEQTLEAIRAGQVDAIVVCGPDGEKVFTLHGAEHAYRVLVEAMSEGALTIAPEGLVLYANRRFAEMSGVPLEKVIGSPFRSYFVEEDAPIIDRLLEQAGCDSTKGEANLLKGKEYVRVNLSLNPMAFDGARALCVIVTDISGVQFNQELVAAERLARAILDQVGDAIVVCSPDGIVMRASNQAALLAGSQPIQKRFDEVFKLRVESGSGAGQQFDSPSLLAYVLQGGHVREQEAQLLREDGEVLEILLGARPLLINGRIRGAVVALTNITAQKLAERRLAVQTAFSTALSTAATLEHGARAVLAAIGGELQAACGEFWGLESGDDRLSCVETWESNGTVLSEAAHARRRRRLSRGEGLVGRMWDSGQPVFTTNVKQDVLLAESPFVGMGFEAAFGFPITVGDRPLGVAIFFCSTTPRLSGAMLEVLTVLGRNFGQFMERKRAEAEILRQQAAIRALSTPVLKVRDRLLILPLIGVVDGLRAKQLTDQLLAAVREHRARAVVIDVTGVAGLDADVANHLVRTVKAARLLGAKTILCGISRALAHTLASIDVDMSLAQTVGDLQSGIEEANYMLGFEVMPIEKRTAKPKPAPQTEPVEQLETPEEEPQAMSTAASAERSPDSDFPLPIKQEDHEG